MVFEWWEWLVAGAALGVPAYVVGRRGGLFADAVMWPAFFVIAIAQAAASSELPRGVSGWHLALLAIAGFAFSYAVFSVGRSEARASRGREQARSRRP